MRGRAVGFALGFIFRQLLGLRLFLSIGFRFGFGDFHAARGEAGSVLRHEIGDGGGEAKRVKTLIAKEWGFVVALDSDDDAPPVGVAVIGEDGEREGDGAFTRHIIFSGSVILDFGGDLHRALFVFGGGVFRFVRGVL